MFTAENDVIANLIGNFQTAKVYDLSKVTFLSDHRLKAINSFKHPFLKLQIRLV